MNLDSGTMPNMKISERGYPAPGAAPSIDIILALDIVQNFSQYCYGNKCKLEALFPKNFKKILQIFSKKKGMII